mgnify:CR=1 FL=1
MPWLSCPPSWLRVGVSKQPHTEDTVKKNITCTWCLDDTAEYWDENFCATHEAEYLGESVASLERGYDIQHAEYLDTLG